MRTSELYAVLSVALLGVACGSVDSTTVGTSKWVAGLNVGNETPAPSGASTATGTAVVMIDGGGTLAGSITYTLTIAGTPTSAITAAHIHTAAAGATGPVRVNLCGPAGSPACPAGAGTVASTTVTYSSGSAAVLGTPAMTFDGLVTQLRGYSAYANVHTTNNPGGEIRGQLLPQ